MATRFDKFTEKAQEAMLNAQESVQKFGHPQMEPEHLLLALIEQTDGIVPAIIDRAGANAAALRGRLHAELERRPRVQSQMPAEGLYLGASLRQAIESAQQEAQRMRDEYVSTEHLLLGLAALRDSLAARVLAEAGLTQDVIYRVMQEVRGSQRVTDPHPESKYQALDRKSTRLNSSHIQKSRMPSSA